MQRALQRDAESYTDGGCGCANGESSDDDDDANTVYESVFNRAVIQ